MNYFHFIKIIYISGMLFVAIMLPLPSGHAAETDWKPDPNNLKGLDGVAMRCVVSSDRKFVHKLCENLEDSTTQKALAKGLRF